MKFSEHWLREWVNPALTTEELVAQLTMAGLEVDAVTPAAPPFTGVVVGEVHSVEPHPGADRLRICQVRAGGAEPLTIVCGATNIHVGMKVPLATVGAVLPDGTAIKASRLSGVESAGMLCSARELGLADQSDGLLELPDTARIGEDVRTLLDLDDAILEIELTPNRGDCLSIAGIAREVAALNHLTVTPPPAAAVSVQHEDRLPIRLDNPAACPRYIGRIVRGIRPNAETPYWLRERLRRSGLRPISAVVDVTNYMLLETGQPMHAFDLDAIQGGIVVRSALNGERLCLLDGQTILLKDGDLVVGDDVRALALAGIMGGADSAVQPSSTDIFLECAFFTPDALAGRARSHGLHTESSHRFERGVDFNMQAQAIERATTLIMEIAGGRAGPLMEASSAGHLPQRQAVPLRQDRIERILGLRLTEDEIRSMLVGLGMRVERTSAGFMVTPPSYRFDIAIENDLIEELARLHGYDKLPSVTFHSALELPGQSERSLGLAPIRTCLIERGYQEAITYSFVDEALQGQLHPDSVSLALLNPISSELGVMRQSLWTGLIKAACLNRNHRQNDQRLFEIGRRFLQDAEGIRQEMVVAGLLTGHAHHEQWGLQARTTDFFDLKGDIEAVLALGGGGEPIRFVAGTHPALHPGQTARLFRNDTPIGWAGRLHPQIESRIEFKNNIYLFEIQYEYIKERVLPRACILPRFPSIRRDVALILDQDITAESLIAAAKKLCGERLAEVTLFDVYQGKGVGNERKSMALGLIFQDHSRTLTEEDVEVMVSNLLSGLQRLFNATLRA